MCNSYYHGNEITIYVQWMCAGRVVWEQLSPFCSDVGNSKHRLLAKTQSILMSISRVANSTANNLFLLICSQRSRPSASSKMMKAAASLRQRVSLSSLLTYSKEDVLTIVEQVSKCLIHRKYPLALFFVIFAT